MREYLLGVGTLPATALAGWALYRGGKIASAWGVRKMRGLPLGKASNRAAFAAACASSRRVYTVSVSGVSLVLTVGFSTEKYEAIRKAVYGVLVPAPTINPKWQRTPADPRLDFSDDGDAELVQAADPGPFAEIVDPCCGCGCAKADHRDGRCTGDFFRCPCETWMPLDQAASDNGS
jgi:hypothetical protein